MDYWDQHRMMWRPVTVGEEIFKHLFESVGRYTAVRNDQHGLDFLLSPERFLDYSQLAVTLELFLRTIRSASDVYGQTPAANAREFAHRLRADTDLPATVMQSTSFCESLKHAGRVVNDRNDIPKQIAKNIQRDCGNNCYLCGCKLVKASGHAHSSTVDHIWPQLFAGESLEDNLLVACKDCNQKKAHAITWAWGPIHHTYELASASVRPTWQVRLSLGLARLMRTATAGSRLLTLKQAALQLGYAVPQSVMPQNRPHLFFEFLRHSETET
jgi:hypothetical protein